MTVVFVSNYFNHHQRALCDALHRETGGNFYFIATSQMREERRQLGYGEDAVPDYVCTAYTSSEEMDKCRALVGNADAVIVGAAPEEWVKQRIWQGKLTLRYTERPFKKPVPLWKAAACSVRWRLRNPAGKPVYLLCAGAYTAADYVKLGVFRNRAYRWGYFPETRICRETLFAEKDKTQILWVGRMLDWKHPDAVIRLAQRLDRQGYDFCLTMIGMGPMEKQIRDMAAQYGLEKRISFPGAMKPWQVRGYMEKAGIFLLTSDRQEGWGAVVNEAMNSGCAVVASHAAGSVPYLVKDGENGQIYPSGNEDMLFEKVAGLLENPQTQQQLGKEACRTVAAQWNAEVAAQRLMQLMKCIFQGNPQPQLYSEGPCSPAGILADDWM